MPQVPRPQPVSILASTVTESISVFAKEPVTDKLASPNNVGVPAVAVAEIPVGITRAPISNVTVPGNENDALIPVVCALAPACVVTEPAVEVNCWPVTKTSQSTPKPFSPQVNLPQPSLTSAVIEIEPNVDDKEKPVGCSVMFD